MIFVKVILPSLEYDRTIMNQLNENNSVAVIFCNPVFEFTYFGQGI